MQIEQIDTYLDLLETRNFNRTAERLGITQSTVSARIAALEKSVGRRLFTRSRAGTDLTTAGLSFERHARGLRHGWHAALRATNAAGNVALSMRIGLQTDLAVTPIGDWVQGVRDLVPDASLYLELDYSNQMCADLLDGVLDLAILYSPRTGPDLHFESVGEVRYRMVASAPIHTDDLRPDTYIRASYAPAFDREHERLFPALSNAAVSSGNEAAISELLASIGGAGYVLEDTADRLVGSGVLHPVAEAPVILQTIYVGLHVRHRHEHVHRRIVALVRDQFGQSRPAPRGRRTERRIAGGQPIG